MFQNPVAHCWTEEKSIKGKFCNVCRKKMQEVPGVRCEGEYVSQSVDGKILISWFAAQHQKKFLSKIVSESDLEKLHFFSFLD